jgi:hypothetical protein
MARATKSRAVLLLAGCVWWLSFLSAQSAWAQTRVAAAGDVAIRPSAGFADGVDYGLDVSYRASPRAQLVASAYHWNGLDYLCTLYCTPERDGWSVGLGGRVDLFGSASRWRPFLQGEAGVHWFDGAGSGFPDSEWFVSGRVGITYAVVRALGVDFGARLQRIPSYRFTASTAEGPISMETGGTTYFAFVTAVTVVVF